ncbi:MAG: hypothetical protein ACM3ZE_08115, partial [Myxococcales bacterium]
EHGGINVPSLVKDLLPDGKLHAFVNTHPHDDHLSGLKELRDVVTVEGVWHTGFEPGSKSGDQYKHLKSLVDDLTKSASDNVLEMDGSRTSQALLDAEVHFLAPAEHVKDDINGEDDAEKRCARIHEHCAVLRVGKVEGSTESWILITGDADLVAFRDHITEYHKDRLPAVVLDASHHGSRSFFKKAEEGEPYLDALEAIDPTYVVISAPTVKESPHDHPHDDAVKLYTDHVGKPNVFHTGKDRESYFIDVYEDGTAGVMQSDNGDLAATYGLDKEGDESDSGGGSGKSASGPFIRPSRSSDEYKPREYA